MYYLLDSSSYANDVSVLTLVSSLCFIVGFCFVFLHVLIAFLTNLCLSSKRKDSEPGTKSLLSNAEMMAHHPTDPVEMRRINFQTPGMKHVPTLAPKHTLYLHIKVYFRLITV